MELGGEAYRGSKKALCAPVKARVEVVQPGVSKNKAIPSEVGDIESFGDLLVSTGDEEVEEMCDLAGLVRGSIDVMEVHRECQLPPT
jgi:hypothetical protein